MVPPTPLEVHVLGGIGQQREPVEGAEYEHLLIERVLGERCSDAVDGAVVRPATIDRDPAHPFDEVEDDFAVRGSDRVAEKAPEQSNVVADRIFGHRYSQAAGGPEGNGFARRGARLLSCVSCSPPPSCRQWQPWEVWLLLLRVSAPSCGVRVSTSTS